MRTRPFALLFLAAALSCACLSACAGTASSNHQEGSSSDASVTQMDSQQDFIQVTLDFDLSLLPGTTFTQGGVEAGDSQVVTIPAGSTVYDALVATGAELEGTPAYVSSINGVGEGQAGNASGWMYMVNGQIPTVAGNELVLEDGDAVQWYYGVWS